MGSARTVLWGQTHLTNHFSLGDILIYFDVMLGNGVVDTEFPVEQKT